MTTKNNRSTSPGQKGRLDKRFTFRVSALEYDAYRATAQQSGMRLSDWARTKLAVDGIKPTLPKPLMRPHVTADSELLRQIAALGNNTNQIARQLNTRSDIPSSIVVQWLLFMNKGMGELLAPIKDADHHDN